MFYWVLDTLLIVSATKVMFSFSLSLQHNMRHQVKILLQSIKILSFRKDCQKNSTKMSFLTLDLLRLDIKSLAAFPLDAGRKLNLYQTFRGCPGCRLLNVLSVKFRFCVQGVVAIVFFSQGTLAHAKIGLLNLTSRLTVLQPLFLNITECSNLTEDRRNIYESRKQCALPVIKAMALCQLILYIYS